MKSVERTFIHFLDDIEESILKIQNYTASYNFKKFKEDEKTVDAVIRNLEIIGEASNKIPKKIKEKYLLVPWEEMYRMRNKAIHEYFGVDHEIIWNIITISLPENLNQIKEILEIER